nr:acetylxylan esterase [Parablautia muri]
MPRNTDKPQNRVEDIHGAVDFIVNYQGVDRERVGILGICGGGGYTLRAAQTDKRMKAVATLSAFNTGIVRKNGFLDSQMPLLRRGLWMHIKRERTNFPEKKCGIRLICWIP